MDRKGWIILLLCGVALAANIYMSGQTRKEQAEDARKAREAEVQPGPPTVDPGGGADAVEGDTPPPVEERLVVLGTGEVVFTLTTGGGGLKTVEILGQHIVGDEKEDVLINRNGRHAIGALTRGTDSYLDEQYEVVSESDREVVFRAAVEGGLIVTKKWSLLAAEEVGSGYRMLLELTVRNDGETAVQLGDYGLALGTASPLYQREWPNQTGVFYQVAGEYEYEHSKWFKGGKRPTFEAEAGNLDYAGTTNQFFTTILRPDTSYEADVWAKRQVVTLKDAAGGGEKDAVAAGVSLPRELLAANGGTKVVQFSVFTGPKKNLLLREINNDYGAVMNYGWFGAISYFLNLLLVLIHDNIFVHIADKWSWGLAIVLLTIVIRGVMWPLQNKSTRSMKRMSQLKEPIAELREKYEDDPQKMNQEMMKLYREYGINPLGGCLPMLVQIPIFFGFYRMLQYAVELRQEKFLWVEDLSQPDTLATIPIFGGLPLNILPIVMAGTMVIQMSLTPKTGDKMQARIFMLMPLIFFFFCYNFASALALYWTTSNIFAIGQTMVTKRMPDPELKKKKKKGPGFMERMQARAEEMQKQKKRGGGRGPGSPGGGAKPKKPRGPRTGG